MQSTEFPMAPYSVSLFYIIALVVGVLMIGLLALFFSTGWGFNHISSIVSPAGLEFKGPYYGQTFDKSKLKLSEARIVNLEEEKDLKPHKRMKGLGMAQLTYGWWKLHNGQKALVAISDMQHAVYIPTTEGFPVIVSPEDPNAFLSALRR
jgi:hypothetical protein